MGIGAGVNHRLSGRYVLTGFSTNGEPIWTTIDDWNNAKYAKSTTEAQRQLLDAGHWEYK